MKPSRPLRLLLIGADATLTTALRATLEQAGHWVAVAGDSGDGATLACAGGYDVLIVDGAGSLAAGYAVIAAARSTGRHEPVLLLADGGAEPVVAMRRPPGPPGAPELAVILSAVEGLARGEAALRRARICHAGIELDRLSHRVWCRGRPLSLTPTEYRLLEYLLLHPNQVVSRDRLRVAVWGAGQPADSNVLDVHVGHLRRKLHAAARFPLLRTLRGRGFTLAAGRTP